MLESDFLLQAKDGTGLFVREWLPDQKPRAVVQVVHGMADHSARYERLAKALTEHGYAVFADDHRGHGRTAKSRDDLGHFADEHGFQRVVEDQLSLVEEIKSRLPGLPVFLLGHSMGSFIARAAVIERGREWSGLVLSATNQAPAFQQRINAVLPRLERLRLGKRGKSAAVRALTFEAFNKKFKDPRTPCDWLSRDPAEVDKYVADPLCGFECSVQTWADLLDGMAFIFDEKNIARMPLDMPIYVLSGQRDPVNGDLKGIRRLHEVLERVGAKNVMVRVYPEARHELFNETNREEVTRDLIEWLDRQLAASR